MNVSLQAYENALKTNVPVLVEDDNVIYKVYPNGKKRKVKTLPKSICTLPKKFNLK